MNRTILYVHGGQADKTQWNWRKKETWRWFVFHNYLFRVDRSRSRRFLLTCLDVTDEVCTSRVCRSHECGRSCNRTGLPIGGDGFLSGTLEINMWQFSPRFHDARSPSLFVCSVSRSKNNPRFVSTVGVPHVHVFLLTAPTKYACGRFGSRAGVQNPVPSLSSFSLPCNSIAVFFSAKLPQEESQPESKWEKKDRKVWAKLALFSSLPCKG